MDEKMDKTKIVTENEMENDLNKVAEVYWDLYKNYEKGDTELNKAIDDWGKRRYYGNNIDDKLRYAQYISQAALEILRTKSYKDLKNGDFRSEHVIPKKEYFLKDIKKIVKDDNLTPKEKEEKVKKIILNRHRICLITAEQDKKITEDDKNKYLRNKLPEEIANSFENDPLKEMELEEEFSRYIECGAFEGQIIFKIKGYKKNYKVGNYELVVEEYFTIPKKKKS